MPETQLVTSNKTGVWPALTPAERAMSDSRRVSQNTLNDLSSRLDQSGPRKLSLSTLLQEADRVRRFLDNLINGRCHYAAGTSGALATNDAHNDARWPATYLEIASSADSFRDPAQLDTISPKIKNKIERVAAPLASAEVGDWNLTPRIQFAM